MVMQIQSFLLHQKTKQGAGANLQITVQLPMLLFYGSWTDWAFDAYQQTFFLLITHSLNSSAN
jgi:hypothetical protein